MATASWAVSASNCGLALIQKHELCYTLSYMVGRPGFPGSVCLRGPRKGTYLQIHPPPWHGCVRGLCECLLSRETLLNCVNCALPAIFLCCAVLYYFSYMYIYNSIVLFQYSPILK